MLLPSPTRRQRRRGALPLLLLTVLGLLLGGLGAPASAASGFIKGTVTDASTLSTTPLAGVTVSLLSSDGNPVMNGTAPITALTGNDGTYALQTPDTMTTSSYKVGFAADGYVPEFFDDARTAASATTITLADGATRTGVDAALAAEGQAQIGGLVKNSSGTPIKDVAITLLERSPASGGTGEVGYAEAGTVSTGADGTWVLDQELGKYVVRISAPAYGTFYFKATNSLTADRDSAPEIEVKEGSPVRLDATLTKKSTTTISGTLTSSGTPVQGVEVSVEYSALNAQGQTTWTEVQSTKAKSAADGTYTATVPPAENGRTYVVGFRSPGFRTQYYSDDSSPAYTRQAATPVTPTIGEPVAGVSAVLTRATQVAGKVTDQAGAGLSGVRVTAVVYTPGTSGAHGSWNPLKVGEDDVATTTLADGGYVLDVPADTKFRLEFVAPDQRVLRYYPSATFADEATTLSVAPSTASTGRDVVLPTLSTIRGQVTEPGGAVYQGAGEVTAWKSVSWTELGEKGGISHTSWFPVPGSTGTISGGAFTVRVPAGSYRLKLVDESTDEEGFLPGLVGLDQAPSVTVGAQQSLTGQSFALPALRTLRGTVTDAAGTAVADALVGAEYTYVADVLDGTPVPSPTVAPKTGSGRREATSQVGGTYSMQVRARSYRVYAQPQAGSTKAFHGDRQEDGTVVPRTVQVSDSDVSGVDISLGAGELQNVRRPWISGLNDQGSTLTANVGTWSPQAGISYAYAWQYRLAPTSSEPNPSWRPLERVSGTREDGLGNPSADGRTVSVPSASFTCTVFGTSCPANAQYKVVVEGTRAGVSLKARESLPTALTSDSAPTRELRADPRVTGQAVVGEVLTADPGVWAEQSTYTYQWFRGLAKIDGATGSTYEPRAADVGSQLSVEVRPTGSTNVFGTSEPTARVGRGTLTGIKAPAISGKAQVGETLTAGPGTWTPTPSSYTYAWLANGQPIAGATAASYTLRTADVAKVVTVQVTALRDGYNPATRTSEGTAPVSLDGTDPTKLVNKTRPSVSGTAQVGRTLTAQEGQWTNDPVSVEVTARREGFDPATVASDATAPVAKGVLVNQEAPSITGTVRPGSTVAALPGSWTPSSQVSFGYQWLLDNAPVAGATSSTYTVKQADLDKLLSVRVTASAPGYADSTATSAQRLVTPDGDTTLEQAAASVVKGEPAVGETLRLVVGTTSPAYGTVAIQWLRDGTPVAGRTGTSYAVARADLGATLSARMTYKRAGYTDLVEVVDTAKVTEPVEPVKPTLKTSKKVKGKKLVVKVRVLADTQDPVTGRVELKEGTKRYALKTLQDGRRKLVVRGLKKGYHSVRLTFLGNDLVKKRGKTLTFTVR